jgi:hypothetical protein
MKNNISVQHTLRELERDKNLESLFTDMVPGKTYLLHPRNFISGKHNWEYDLEDVDLPVDLPNTDMLKGKASIKKC